MRASSIQLVALLAITLILTVPGAPVDIKGESVDGKEKTRTFSRDITVDSDSWPMYMGSTYHQGFSSSEIPMENDTDILWGQRVDNLMESVSPVIADGVVYLGSGDGRMRGYDIDTGEIVWSVSIGNHRIRAAASIDNNVIYFGADNGHLYGFRLSDSVKVLDIDLGGSEILSSPLIIGDRAYIGVLGAFLRNHEFHAIDISRKEVNWTLSMGDQENFYGFKETAAYHNGRIYIGNGNGSFYCLDEWGFWDGNDGPYTSEGNESLGSPDIIWMKKYQYSITTDAMLAEGNVFFGDITGRLYCLNTTTGDDVWNRTVARGLVALQSCPTYHNGRVYTTGRNTVDQFEGGTVYSLDSSDGSQVWRFNITGQFISESSPVITDGAIVFGARNQKVYCLSTIEENIADEDRIIWSISTGSPVASSPAIAEGRVFISNQALGEFGKLFAIGAPDPEVEDVWISDPLPYIGESVRLGADMINNATVDCYIDVEFKVSNINNSKQEIVGVLERVWLPAKGRRSVQINWTVKPRFEFLAVFIKDVTPEDLEPENNFATLDLTIKTQLSGFWTSSGSGPEKDAGSGRSLESNRSYWEYAHPVQWTGTPESPWYEGFHGNGTISSSGSAIYFTDPLGNLVAMNTSLGEDGEPGMLWKYSNSSVDFTGRPVVLVDRERSFNGPNKIFSYADDGALWAFDWIGFWDQDNDGEYISETARGRMDGDVIWRSEIPEPIGPIIISGGNIIVMTADNDMIGIDDDTGEILWTEGMPYSQKHSMAADQYSIYLSTDNSVIVMDPTDGEIKYSMLTAQMGDNKAISVTEQGLLITSNNSTSLYDADPSDGVDEGVIDNSTTSDLLWRIEFGTDLHSPPAISPANQVIGIVQDQRIGFHHLNNGTEISNLTFDGEQTGRVVSGGDSFYFITGSSPWKIRSVTPTDINGYEFTWTLDLSSRPRGELVIVSDNMFISQNDGRILSIGADNNAPVAVISSPDEGILLFPGEALKLDASMSYDEEGDPLTYAWILEGVDDPIYEGEEPVVNLTVEGVGTKVLTLRVYDDMRAYGEAEINITLLRRGRFVYEDSLYNIRVEISYGISEPSGLILVNSSIPEDPPKSRGSVFIAKMDLTVWPGYAHYRFEYANVSILYSDKEFEQRLNVDKMSVFRFDQEASSWKKPTETGVDSETKIVYGNFTEFISGFYAIGILDNGIPELRHRPTDDYRYKMLDSTEFKFRVEYRDEDNEQPEYIKLVIDNETEYMLMDEGFSSSVIRWSFYSMEDIPISPGDHSYYFEAYDGNFMVTSPYYDFFVNNNPPVAVIVGPTSVVYVGDIVLFDGSDSYDPDGDEITWSWDFNDKDGIQKDKVDSKVDTIYYDEGNYVVTLTVSDGVDKTEKTLSITVLDKDEGSRGSNIPAGVWIMVIVIISILILFIMVFIIITRRGHEEHRDLTRRFEGKWTCPECGTSIPNGVEECPKCDYIYDPMDFDDEDIDDYMDEFDEM